MKKKNDDSVLPVKINKEADEYFRSTPPDVDEDTELNDKLSNIERNLTDEQLKALKT